MIAFYYLSGSPFTWRVWLALEHKALKYKRIELSLEKGDLKSDSYLALNPRGKVPVIVDGDFSIYESGVILEYLEEKYPDFGAHLFPKDIQSRTLGRRLINEIRSKTGFNCCLCLVKGKYLWSENFSVI